MNGKGFFIPARNGLNILLMLRPEHSGKNIGMIFSPFLAGIEEPFTVASGSHAFRATHHNLAIFRHPFSAAKLSLCIKCGRHACRIGEPS